MQDDWGVKCAVWHFFHPSILHILFNWLCEKGLWKDSLTDAPFIPECRITEFKEALNSKGDTDRASHIITVEQKGGDLVSVPPGYAHQVQMVRPCVKVAWDFVKDYSSMPIYASVQQLIRQHTRAIQAFDYMGVFSMATTIASSHPH